MSKIKFHENQNDLSDFTLEGSEKAIFDKLISSIRLLVGGNLIYVPLVYESVLALHFSNMIL